MQHNGTVLLSPQLSRYDNNTRLSMRIGSHIISTKGGVRNLVPDERSDGSSDSSFLVAKAKANASSMKTETATIKLKKKSSSRQEDSPSKSTKEVKNRKEASPSKSRKEASPSKRRKDVSPSKKRSKSREHNDKNKDKKDNHKEHKDKHQELKQKERKEENGNHKENKACIENINELSAAALPESNGAEDESCKRSREAPRDRRSSIRQRTRSTVELPSQRRVSRRSSMTSVSSRSSNMKRRGSMDAGLAINMHVRPTATSIVKSQKSNRPACKKRVSFDETCNVSYDNQIMDEEDVRELWFDQYHLESFRTELETLVGDITTKLKKRTEVWRKKMMRAYDVGCNAESDAFLHDTSSSTFTVMAHTLKDLYKETAQLVGLEHHLADEIRSDGNRRRARVLDLMDKIRDERERRRVLKIPLPLDDDTDHEKLFKECMEASLASRCWAHGTAVARAAAASPTPSSP
ncbi:hypothetical protein ACA910_022220 [Epithemia clementina (nom. ined.)]